MYVDVAKHVEFKLMIWHVSILFGRQTILFIFHFIFLIISSSLTCFPFKKQHNGGSASLCVLLSQKLQDL